MLESVPSDENDFDGNAGDIILGGGGGEVPAFRIAYPRAFEFFLMEDLEDFEFESNDELFKAFWTPTESYIFCDGFLELGWTPDTPIELWLAKKVCQILVDSQEKYSKFKATDKQIKTGLSFSLTHGTSIDPKS